MFTILGTPNEKIWPGYNKLPAPQKMKFIEYPYATLRQKFPVNMLTESGMDLLKRFLTYDPKQRITCDEVRIVLSFISECWLVPILLSTRNSSQQIHKSLLILGIKSRIFPRITNGYRPKHVSNMACKIRNGSGREWCS